MGASLLTATCGQQTHTHTHTNTHTTTTTTTAGGSTHMHETTVDRPPQTTHKPILHAQSHPHPHPYHTYPCELTRTTSEVICCRFCAAVARLAIGRTTIRSPSGNTDSSSRLCSSWRSARAPPTGLRCSQRTAVSALSTRCAAGRAGWGVVQGF